MISRNYSQYEAYLPIGYTDEQGDTHRFVLLRKMRGYEEARLYQGDLSPSDLITELILGCLLRLGTLETLDENVINNLYTADRNFLLLELRRITLGDAMRAAYHCPRCQRTVTVIEDLSTFTVRHLAEDAMLQDIELELDDGYVDRENRLHRTIVMTLPRGTDERFVAPTMSSDALQARDALLLRCIKQFGDLPRAALEGYGIKIMRELTLGDRRALYAAFNDEAPGVDFRRWIECEHCGAQFESVLDLSDFFALS